MLDFDEVFELRTTHVTNASNGVFAGGGAMVLTAVLIVAVGSCTRGRSAADHATAQRVARVAARSLSEGPGPLPGEAQIDEIERTVRLPPAALPLHAYDRYYSPDQNAGRRYIVATLINPPDVYDPRTERYTTSPIASRHVTPEPPLTDIGLGCLKVTARWDVEARRVVYVGCDAMAAGAYDLERARSKMGSRQQPCASAARDLDWAMDHTREVTEIGQMKQAAVAESCGFAEGVFYHAVLLSHRGGRANCREAVRLLQTLRYRKLRSRRVIDAAAAEWSRFLKDSCV